MTSSAVTPGFLLYDTSGEAEPQHPAQGLGPNVPEIVLRLMAVVDRSPRDDAPFARQAQLWLSALGLAVVGNGRHASKALGTW